MAEGLTDQWDRTESPETEPTQIQSVEFWQKCKGYSMKKGRAFQGKVLDQLHVYMQKTNLGTRISHLIQKPLKINHIAN